MVIKLFTVYKNSKIQNSYMEKLKPNHYYNNINNDLYIADTTGNMYKLPQQATITQRDIFIFISAIKQVLNVDFERIIKTWE